MSDERHDFITTRHADGAVTVSHFPEELWVTPELMGAWDPRLVETCVHFEFTNGSAEYHVTGYDAERRCLVLGAVTRSPVRLVP